MVLLLFVSFDASFQEESFIVWVRFLKERHFCLVFPMVFSIVCLWCLWFVLFSNMFKCCLCGVYPKRLCIRARNRSIIATSFVVLC